MSFVILMSTSSCPSGAISTLSTLPISTPLNNTSALIDNPLNSLNSMVIVCLGVHEQRTSIKSAI